MPFSIGENVGAYRIVEKLGQGGMATVYKAYHPSLDRYVAIKVMHQAFMEDPNFLARFQREARIVAKLDHPHIIPIYDFAEHQGNPYLVMRFVEGETLKARILHGPVEPREVLRIAQAVGEALTYAHKQGILHRDIKPSNILLTPDGGVYLTDFGLARMAETSESTLSRDMMIGTPQYISPEQAKGITKLDARTDIYSLGVVLYELLVGRVPFAADTPYAIIHDHIFAPLPLPRTLNPDLPEAVERVLLKALAKEPNDRYQSVEELIQALTEALQPIVAPKMTAAPIMETAVAPSSATQPATTTPPPTAVHPLQAAAKPQAPAVKEKAAPNKRRWKWAVTLIGGALGLCLFASLCLATSWLRDTQGERLLGRARAARNAGNYGDALNLYDRAVEAAPELIDAYIEASEVQAAMGDIEGAMQTLVEGLEANPYNVPLLIQLAGDAILAGQWDVAESALRGLRDNLADDAITHAYIGVSALEKGGPCESALPELEHALDANPTLPWAHYGLALCRQREGRMEEARSELEQVLAQEIPVLLRNRAEEMMSTLSLTPEEAVLRKFDALVVLANEITDRELKARFQELVAQARTFWENGDRQRTTQVLRDALIWTRENRGALGDALAGRLILKLRDIMRLTEGPQTTP